MLIKSADDRQPDIDALNRLLARPEVDAATHKRIEQEIRSIRAGVAGERDAAYEINFHYRESANRAIIHDLRLEVGERVAQIDHLMITRLLQIWIFESKHFAEGVGVNEHGEWVAFWGGRPHGIPSPIEQNRKHETVLNEVFDRGLVELPRRLGATLKPHVCSLVLVSSGARISRPKVRGQQKVDGLDSVIKVDRLRRTLEDQVDKMSTLDVLKAGARVVSTETIEGLGRQLAALHRPASVDWAARYGLATDAAAVAPNAAAVAPVEQARTQEAPADRVQCAECGAAVSEKVAAYCEANSARFGGRTLCWNCQRRRH